MNRETYNQIFNEGGEGFTATEHRENVGENPQAVAVIADDAIQTQTRASNMKNAAAQTLLAQSSDICAAIEILRETLNAMVNNINPDSVGWADVAMFAHVADAARDMTVRLSESE